jgi:hypothetical protein
MTMSKKATLIFGRKAISHLLQIVWVEMRTDAYRSPDGKEGSSKTNWQELEGAHEAIQAADQLQDHIPQTSQSVEKLLQEVEG